MIMGNDGGDCIAGGDAFILVSFGVCVRFEYGHANRPTLSVSPLFDDPLSFSPTYAHDSMHEHIHIATDGSARLKVFCTREFGS